MLAIIILICMVICSLLMLAICSIPSFEKEMEDLEQMLYLNEKFKKEEALRKKQASSQKQ